jgi:DNA-binding NtrC family response regulator
VAAVLIVEDNADLRDMYSEILGMGGHEARAAETADEALAAIAASRPEVLVLDLGISGGYEDVVKAVAGAEPVAVILASGARDLADHAAAIGAASLQKPFGPEALLAAVERALARR